MTEHNRISWTETGLTIGSLGGVPLSTEKQVLTAKTIANWCELNNAKFRLETYMDHPDDWEALRLIAELFQGRSSLELTVRVQPRSDRFHRLAEAGVTRVVFEAPVSEITAAERFLPDGIARAVPWSVEQGRAAMLEGLQPEIALTDITRSRPELIAEMVQEMETIGRAYGVLPNWRLVDSIGSGSPFKEDRLPVSLPAWCEFFTEDLRIDLGRIAFQGSNALGLALANTLSCCRRGISPVSSLFGLGTGAGWTASEQLLYHQTGGSIPLGSIIELKESLLQKNSERYHEHAPISGKLALEIPGGSSPEKAGEKWHLFSAYDPARVTGNTVEPVLTDLSGHAGLLHLAHRHFPEMHIETDEPKVRAVYARYETEFGRGRNQPVTWYEVKNELSFLGKQDMTPNGELKEVMKR